MGLHMQLNSRSIPLLGKEHYLPKNITLIYAGSDRPNLHKLCELMKECDKRATTELRKLKFQNHTQI